MSGPFTIYGIRLKGDKEVRYIGQTSRAVEERWFGHLTAVRANSHCNDGLRLWLREHRDSAEIFKIGYADTVEEARGIERALIGLCRRLDHRLFNLPPGPRRKSAPHSDEPAPATIIQTAAVPCSASVRARGGLQNSPRVRFFARAT